MSDRNPPPEDTRKEREHPPSQGCVLALPRGPVHAHPVVNYPWNQGRGGTTPMHHKSSTSVRPGRRRNADFGPLLTEPVRRIVAVIPVHNEAATITTTVEAVLWQTRQPDELIVL